ncbi:MAG: hypothetical protein GAK43_00126 [Stenotrophomonas maltophilia]|nr:MAG: hypothetical protein GAK43_00126 [Stenotrophomonas maltophilia]
MRRFLVAVCSGVLTGGVIATLAFPWLARTAAIAMPRTFNVYLWDALVVFGLGASMLALPLMLLALRLTRARGLEAATMLAAAILAVVAALKVADALEAGGKVLLAWPWACCWPHCYTASGGRPVRPRCSRSPVNASPA